MAEYRRFSERYGGGSVLREMREREWERARSLELNEPQRTWWRTNPGGGVELIPPDELRANTDTIQEELRRAIDSIPYFVDNYCYVQENPNAAGPAISVTYAGTASSGINWDDLRASDSPVIPTDNDGNWQLQYLGPNIPEAEVQWNRPVDPLNDIAAMLETMGIGHGHMHRDNSQALAKSKALLCSFLTDEQIEELDTGGRITVKAESGATYRIMATTAAYNVKYLDKRTDKWSGLCAVPKHSLPLYDMMLSQMLALQTDEEGFLKTANRDSYPNVWGEAPLQVWSERVITRDENGVFNVVIR